MFIIRTVRLLEISCCLCYLVCQLTLIVFAPFLLLIIIIILLLFLSVDHEIVHGRSQELPVLSVEFWIGGNIFRIGGRKIRRVFGGRLGPLMLKWYKILHSGHFLGLKLLYFLSYILLHKLELLLLNVHWDWLIRGALAACFTLFCWVLSTVLTGQPINLLSNFPGGK